MTNKLTYEDRKNLAEYYEQDEIIKVPVIFPYITKVDAKCPYCGCTTIGFDVEDIGTVQGCGFCSKKFELMLP